MEAQGKRTERRRGKKTAKEKLMPAGKNVGAERKGQAEDGTCAERDPA